jgi:PAS domain S-box-containing protein
MEQRVIVAHGSSPLPAAVLSPPTEGALGLLDHFPIGVFTCDRSGRLLRYNAEAAELWGHQPAPGDMQYRFDGAFKLLRLDGRVLLPSELPVCEVLDTARPVRNRRFAIERPDGTRLAVMANANPLLDTRGELIGAIACIQAIGSFEDAGPPAPRPDEGLGDQHRRLCATYEAADIGLAEADADGRHLRVNEALCAITGYSREAMLERTFFDNTHPDDVEPDRTLYARQVAGEMERYAVEKRYLRSDGSAVWVSVKSSAMRDSQGRFLYGIRVIQDISQRKRIEETLREREQQFRDLLEALPAAVYTTDAAGRITFYNQAAVELAGRVPKIGRDRWCVTWRLRWPDGRPLPHDECPMAMTLKENRAIRGYEIMAERPDGTCAPVIPYPTPLRDESGNLTGAVNMLVDVSERKQSEAAQRVLLNELNHRVKNNLQMLYALLRSAQRETHSDEARDVLREASQRVAAMAAAQHALYTANNTAHFSAKTFLDSVCSSAQQTFVKDVELVVADAHGELSNDTAMPLALILNELLTNAVKHGITGNRGTIHVGMIRKSECVELYVEDPGPGFALEDVRKRSSGLGLVMGLARQLGGDFKVERASRTRCAVTFAHPYPGTTH